MGGRSNISTLDAERLIFLHGQDSNSQTYKAALLRGIYPDILVPDFVGPLDERMRKLEPILGAKINWTIIGSSFGGLMAALFALRRPEQVRKLILLAPALLPAEISLPLPAPINVPTIIIHGRQDSVVPYEAAKLLAEKIFLNLDYRLVEDDHRLHKTAESLDWRSIIE